MCSSVESLPYADDISVPTPATSAVGEPHTVDVTMTQIVTVYPSDSVWVTVYPSEPVPSDAFTGTASAYVSLTQFLAIC